MHDAKVYKFSKVKGFLQILLGFFIFNVFLFFSMDIDFQNLNIAQMGGLKQIEIILVVIFFIQFILMINASLKYFVLEGDKLQYFIGNNLINEWILKDVVFNYRYLRSRKNKSRFYLIIHNKGNEE